ncbi:MAG: LysE family transporter [Bacteroidales bacterium]|nr:LysE family transporter [Bacteroidales bacterium]
MDSILFLVKGFLIGLLASMPVGAIAIMAVQRTMNNGLWAGFSIGMGAALGDIVYAAVAGFGINFIRDFLLDNRFWLALIGGVFLIFIGYKIYKSDTVKQYRSKKKVSKRKMANDFASSFILALSNPVTILGFTGFFASAGIIGHNTTLFHILILLGGVFVGATSWWFGISLTVNHFKKKITLRKIVMINRVTGVLIVVLGIGIIIGMFVFK